MKSGDTVISISKKGKRRGQRGTLVGELIEATQKWTVQWSSDGVEKAYAVKNLKKFDATSSAVPAWKEKQDIAKEKIQVQDLLKKQGEVLPAAIAEIKRTRRLVKRVTWWAFPIDTVGSDEPKPGTRVTRRTAGKLVSGAPPAWREFLELVCTVGEDKTIGARVLSTSEHERVRQFVRFWSGEGPAWLQAVVARLQVLFMLSESAAAAAPSKMFGIPKQSGKGFGIPQRRARAAAASGKPAPKVNGNFTLNNWGGERSTADALGLSAGDVASAITVKDKESGSDWSDDEEDS